MVEYTRRDALKRGTALGATVGLSGLAGCSGILGGGGSQGLRFNFTVPIENTGSLFDIPEIQDELPNVGEEYELNVSQDGATTDSVNALAAGETDVVLVANVSYANTILGEAIPGGLTAIASGFGDAYEDNYGFTVYSLPDSDITEPEDLEDATLAVNTLGGGIYAVWMHQLREVGLSENDVEFVEQGFPTFAAGLRDGIFDAAIFPALFAPEPRSEGFTEVFRSQDVLDPYPHAFLATGNNVLDNKEDNVRAFLDDYQSLIDYAFDNRDEVVSLASEHFEISEETVDAFYLTENDYYRGSAEINMDELQYAVDLVNDVDVIEESFDVTEYATNEYLP
ncbi:ABC transporter substrate-binding protein [Halostagnicola kamekurae]|uniref:NitT/TauT family transport system substrate-binding protein n=1 Tax=Halostagnicola kamekurae TaxID=619731 RepID=A0A1I6TRR6_9EURY|nr:ABC transporter substrate-binding protein [Halostagnicola kamekurae]SFS91896.1 NitT/TauT family transport system substrate-binding protein [Halostagnicola kamekurae]